MGQRRALARNVQGSIATEAIAKRRNASANTGITATSGFDSATYVPTNAIDAVSSKYAMNLDDVGAVLMCEATIPDVPCAHMHIATYSATTSQHIYDRALTRREIV